VNLLNCAVNSEDMLYYIGQNHLVLCHCFHILCDYVLDLEVMENEAKICLSLNHPNIGMYVVFV